MVTGSAQWTVASEAESVAGPLAVGAPLLTEQELLAVRALVDACAGLIRARRRPLPCRRQAGAISWPSSRTSAARNDRDLQLRAFVQGSDLR